MSSNRWNNEAAKSRAEDQEQEITVEIPIDPEVDEALETSSSASSAGTENSSDVEQFQTKLKESEEKRAEAEHQVREFAERFRLAQAQLKTEAEEQRARMQRSFDQRLEVARGDIVAGLLDTLDNLKRAVAAAEKSEIRDADFDALLEGIRATAIMFESNMQSLGLTPIKSVGEEFNPEIHEAVEIVPTPVSQDNHVIDEYQTGYRFGDRLLRPARVRVGRAG